MRLGIFTAALSTALAAATVRAQTPTPTPAPAPTVAPVDGGEALAPPLASVDDGSSHTSRHAAVTFSGYVEAFYSFNFNLPANDITAYRGFDNRHNTFSIANAVLDAAWALGPVSGRIGLQIGTTPETYYLAEPVRGATAGVGASGPNVWKYLQQANVAWRAPAGRRGILLEAGLFLSPIGPEGMAVKDQWNWSRSNLFYGLPFYHTGLRATVALSDRWSATAAVYNGWNNVTDNNDEKAVSAQFTYALADRLTVNLLYFGGVERPPGAPEGRAWRHLLDAYAVWYPTAALSLLVHADAGVEPNDLGTAYWAAGALYARLRTTAWLYLAARGDFFYEVRPPGGTVIFWPGGSDGLGWVSSGTFTLDARPHDNVSIQLEYRHDQGAVPMFFSRTAVPDGMGGLAATARAQDTATLGITTWF